MEAVAGEEVVEKLGPHQLALRHHLRHQSGFAARLELECDRIVVLEIGIVAREIFRIHVEEHGPVKGLRRLLPDKGGVVIGLQQFEQVMPDRLANLAFDHVLGQQPEDTREHPAFRGRYVHDARSLADNHGRGNHRRVRSGQEYGLISFCCSAL